jgi:hypothetical protein
MHGKNFHPFLNLMLAGRQQFPLRRPATTFLAVNLDDAQTADCHRIHVWLVTQDRNRNLGLVAELLHIKFPRRIEDGCVSRRSAPFQIDDNISVGIRQRLSQGNSNRQTVDLKSYFLGIVGFGWRI